MTRRAAKDCADNDFQWQAAMWDASDCDWGPAPLPAYPAPVQELPRRSIHLTSKTKRCADPAEKKALDISASEDTTFDSAIVRHFETLKDIICKEHEQASKQLRDLVSTLQDENRHLRSRSRADSEGKQTTLAASSAPLQPASAWRNTPSRHAVIDESEELDYMNGKDRVCTSFNGSSPCAESSPGDALRGNRAIPSTTSSANSDMFSVDITQTGTFSMPAAGNLEDNYKSPVETPEAAPFMNNGSSSDSVLFAFELRKTWLPGLHLSGVSMTWTDDIADISRCSAAYNKVKVSSQMMLEPESMPLRRRFLLSPSSNTYVAWQLVFLVALSYEMIRLPMDVFEMPNEGFFVDILWFATIFWTCDLLLTFFTGFFDQDGVYVATFRSIAWRYARTWLLFDVICCASDWIAVLSEQRTFRVGKVVRQLRVTRVLKFLKVLKVLRLRKLGGALDRVDDYVNSLYFTTIKRIWVNMAGILVLSHFFGCLWYWVGVHADEADAASWIHEYEMESYSWVYKYVTSLHWSITQFTPGSMHVQPQNVPERTFAVLMLVMGMVIFSSIISNVNAATSSLKRITQKYDTELQLLRRFFRQERISNDLLLRVLRYTDNIVKPKMLKIEASDVALMMHLPKPLYMEVVLEIYDQDLEVLPFFEVLKLLAPPVMSKICLQALTPISLSRLSELFSPGDKADATFFLTMGRSEYVLELEPPQKRSLEAYKNYTKAVPICEAVLWTPWHMQGRMVARTECELVQIEAAKFGYVLESNQRVMPLARMYGAEFVKGLNDLIGGNDAISDLVDVPSANEILAGMKMRVNEEK